MARTPSPWRVEPGGFVGGPVGFGRVCQTWNKFEEDFQNAEANAHLIAAAPDLLEVAHIEHELQMGGYTRATVKRLGQEAEDAYLSGGSPALNDWRRRKREAAIAKAEGTGK